ncbi:MAG TPA: PQQ-dependent dehydrogenase, methanol/ethanol family [Xanthobacteraceae bacterium]|nr:PQQ-dependent dehydrogenase, methanol/ethanol family [Xanthobacteraceae bacterium]
MRTRSVASVVGALLMATALTPIYAADMTHERALNVAQEPQNWLLHHGNFQGHRFSALKEINTDTAKNLKLAFTVALGGFEGAGTRYKFGNLEATPLIEDGIMYVPDGWGTVYAIDVSQGKKGTIKWRMDPETNKAWAGDVACCGVNNRGVALWKDKVISVTLDGRLIATNKATGEKVWERKIADPAIAETLTLAPLIVRDVAIVGTAGGEFGIRGFIDGTDLNTGQGLWRTYTIPGAGEPGNETWKDGKDRWKHGGASVWETATYDPETDTFYQGIGNAGADWDPEYRPGDNKWAASVLALSPSDGKIKWGYQYTPNDPYDYDEISEHPIIDAVVNGENRKLVVHAARNGFFYALDRTNGAFVAGKQYVDELNWTPGLDPKTGRPLNYDPTKDVQEYAPGSHGSRANPQGGRLCPSHVGGKNWEPSAYNPELRLLFIPSIEGCNQVFTDEQKDFIDQGGTVTPRTRFAGGGTKTAQRLYGSLKAVDPVTGDTKANLRLEYPNYSGTLATAGNLVFLGHSDGTFSAHDAKTLKEVWSFNAGTGINAPPITYSVNGKQYVAVLVGSKQPNAVMPNAPELKHTSTASMLYVFSL